MGSPYSIAFAPVLGGLLVAVAVWLASGWRTRRRRAGPLVPAGRAVAVVAGAVPLLVVVGFRLWQYSLVLFGVNIAPETFRWRWDIRFLLPLVLGVLGLAVLAFARVGRRGHGAADVVRRTPWMFLPRGLAVAFVALVAFAVALALAAGVASEPDEQGLYRLYTVDAGAVGMGFGDFYGWYYSVPAMIALGALLLLIVGLAIVTARPALAPGRERLEDFALRRRRMQNALLIAIGGLLLHLWSVFEELASVASSWGMSSAGDAGTFFFVPPFAALEPALSVAALCAFGLGVAAWAGVVLSAIPVRRRGKALGEGQAGRLAGADTDPT